MPKPEASALPLVFEGVSLQRGGRTLLSELSFTLGASGVTVLLGPNGSGKSLTLRLADGLLAPSAGRIRWGDQGGDTRASRALVLQRPVLLRRSVEANLRYALRVRGVPDSERMARIDRALVETRLEPRRHQAARSLSVGQQHQLALARAWALRPELLLLDEPAASLDPGGAAALEATIGRIRDDGTKIWLTTHDLDQARRMADEILFLHQGRLLEQTPAAEFFEKPRSEAARAFLRRELL